MANTKMFKKFAFLSLLGSGIFVFLLGIVVFAIGLALTHNDTFNDNKDLKSVVRPRIDYVQYWVGIPFAITGISIICTAFKLRKMRLTICTLILSMVCVVLSLAGLVVDGPDFSQWKYIRAKQHYWENQSGYACISVGDTCVCEGSPKGNSGKDMIITSFANCETLMDLSTVYGVLIGSMVAVLVILLATIFMIVYVITTKREKAHRSNDRYQSKKVIAVSSNDPDYPDVALNPVYDSAPTTNRGYDAGPTTNRRYDAGPTTNRGYDAGPTTNRGYDAGPTPPQGYDNGRSRELNEHKKPNDDTLRIQDKEGIVMMDPGRFKLGDDDIY